MRAAPSKVEVPGAELVIVAERSGVRVTVRLGGMLGFAHTMSLLPELADDLARALHVQSAVVRELQEQAP